MPAFASSFQSTWDVVGFVLFILVFPVYHASYPLLARWRPGLTARGKLDRLRRSWIEGLIQRGDVMAAAQQTRNLTMVNSLLVSSALLLMGLVANMLLQAGDEAAVAGLAGSAVQGRGFKLVCLLLVLALAFSYFMTALRHLGNFVLLIGADPGLVEEEYGEPVEFFAGMINRASHRYSLGVRCFYAATPLLAWLLDARLFVLVSFLWGLKFVAFQDFARDRPRD